MQPFALSCILLAAALGVSAQIADPSVAAELIAKLLTVPTQSQRLALLSDSDFVFNFIAGVGMAKGAGGSITTANVADFPALIGNGMVMVVGIMEPCGFNTPHIHPRTTELLYVINGTGLEVGFIEENGARFVSNTLLPGEAMIFPKGSIHFQANLGCEPLQFVAGLNNVDLGVISVAQRHFGLPVDVVTGSLGHISVEEAVGLAQSIPDNMALGVQQCLDACNLSRTTQPTDQLQPRASANAVPYGSTSSSNFTPSGTARKRSRAEHRAIRNTSDLQFVPSPIDDLIFMLQVIVGFMLFGYIAIGANYVLRRCRSATIKLPDGDYSLGNPAKV